ncbi:MAG: hypothetical protein BWY31_00195 [Lentisphaerae bacterium ADurb.Bin242]|nr:MAG: hypothetical protein BWY31_00195 [Lentisphaerae bacterium ADurb.Bin242]
MALPEPAIITNQIMVMILLREFFPDDQFVKDVFESLKVMSPLFHLFTVLFELRGNLNCVDHDFRSSSNSLTLE